MNLRNYIPQLTFPRFLAASLVVIYHYGSHTFPFNSGFLKEIISQGSIAVSFFFFLSGLVLSLNYFHDDTLSFKGFMWRRIARIYPIYLFAFILTLVSAMLLRNAYPKGFSVILQLLCLHAWNPGTCLEINYPGWSISVEMFLYLLFPVVIFLFRKMKMKTIWIWVIAVWIASAGLHIFMEFKLYNPDSIAPGEFILYFPLWHLNSFLFGIGTGVLIKNSRDLLLEKSLLPFGIFTTGLVLMLLILGTENFIRPHIHNGLLSPLYLMLTLGLALDKTVFSRIIGRPELVFLGDISYGIYIMQFPVYLLFTKVLEIESVNGKYFYIYFIVLVVVCSITYYLIEKQFRKILLR